MEKKIGYLNRNFSDYKQALVDLTKKYYPDINVNYDDASVGDWIITLAADVADNLSYHVDRVFQETNIDSAQEKSSLYTLARNCGFKIPGPKGAMAEVQFKCTLPVNGSGVDWSYAPVIKRGTKVASSSQQFELLEDIDFSKQFNDDGYSDRTISPSYNTNEVVTGYTVTKLGVVIAGESRIYRQSVYDKDIKPFMEIVLPFENIMNIESVIEVEGDNIQAPPTYGAFYSQNSNICGDGSQIRYFEVDNLAQREIWGDKGENPVSYQYEDEDGNTIYSIYQGEWKPITHKFLTEYTDRGYLKLIFGSGSAMEQEPIGTTASDYAKYRISRIINNNNMGALPKPGNTIFVLYRVGGGASSNVPKGAINRIAKLNIEQRGAVIATNVAVRNSLSVVNTIPSVSGKDMPTKDELKYMIKYHTSAQERCVTIKDYVDRILLLPPRYGTPFRVGVMEENNKVMIYLLGINHLGNLDSNLPVTLIENIQNYLAKYRMINDFVEIKPGRIINLSFNVDVIMDKNYNKVDVAKSIATVIKDYMDINKHQMGEELYIGDLQKTISQVDGVINLVSMRIYNKVGDGHSESKIGQETIEDEVGNPNLLDLEATDYIIYNESGEMAEILDPDKDIIIRLKER